MRRLWFGLLLFVGVGMAYSGYHWWHSAASTTASIQPKPASSTVLGSEISLQPWQTTSFSTQRPSGWRQLQATENANGPIYGSYVLTGTGKQQSDQLAVTVGRLGNNSLQETSAVKVRANQPQTYQQISLPFMPSGGVTYRQSQQYELAAFWQHDQQYVAVVSSGPPQNKAELDQGLEAVVSNWQWR